MRHFTTVQDAGNIRDLVQKALAIKQAPLAHKALGEGKRLGLLFLNPSMRTRISTQVAAQNLGMEAIVFNMDKEGWKLELEDGVVMNGSTAEHIRDAAPVLGSYFDVLGIRTFPELISKEDDYSEKLIAGLVRYAGVPIISLESTTLHPLQSLTDIITITETFREQRKPKVVLTWAPHIKPIPQCVANSFAEWVLAWGGADFTITHPEGMDLDERYTAGASIEYDQQRALQDADYIYVKNWSGYQDYGKVLTGAEAWMMTPGHLQNTHNAHIMHCLPVRRDVELSSTVLDSLASIVTLQAANRVWAAQAVLAELLTANKKEAPCSS